MTIIGRLQPSKRFIKMRPMLSLAVSYVAGLWLGQYLPYGWLYWAIAATFFLLTWLFRKNDTLFVRFVCVALCALGIARISWGFQTPTLPPLGTWTVEGTLNGTVTQTDTRTRFVLSNAVVKPSEGEPFLPLKGNIYVTMKTPSGALPMYGDRVQVVGAAAVPIGPRNPGAFDERMWMRGLGATVRLVGTSSLTRISTGGFSIMRFALTLRETLGERIDTLFGGAAPLVRAMLLGDKGDMPTSWTEAMRFSGLAHLLAVSGLHVGLWFVLVKALLKPIPFSPLELWITLAVLLGFYSLLTGLSPSVLRASLMLLHMEGGRVFRREVDPVTSLSQAALIILLFRPFDLFGLGFQLSVTAVIGIIFLYPNLKKLCCRMMGQFAGNTLAMSLAANLGMLPVTMSALGYVSLAGLLANIIAIPLAGLLLPISALAVLVSFLWVPLGYVFSLPVRGIAVIILGMADVSSAAVWARVRLASFAIWTTTWVYACIFLCSTAVRWRGRQRAIAITVLLTIGMAVWSLPVSTRYVQLDVGQALAGVLEVGRATYAFDVGLTETTLVDFLAYEGRSLDALFLTHPHSDHAGGLKGLVEAGVSIKVIYIPQDRDIFGAYAEALALAEQNGAVVIPLSQGDRLAYPNLTIEVMAPAQGEATIQDPNGASLALFLQTGGLRLFITGDSPRVIPQDCNVLQVSHHGSAKDTTEAFLAIATPEVALISAGVNNPYNHPHIEVTDRLNDSTTDWYVTADHGALIVYALKDFIRVEAMRR